MRDLKVAVRYAGALLISAREQGVVEGVGESYAAMLEVVQGNRDLRTFMDGMMEMGPVPVSRYRERMLGQTLDSR